MPLLDRFIHLSIFWEDENIKPQRLEELIRMFYRDAGISIEGIPYEQLYQKSLKSMIGKLFKMNGTMHRLHTRTRVTRQPL